MPRPLCIAIDGPASSGKGTVARLAAHALGYAYVDTGALYRAVALLAFERGVSLQDANAVAALASAATFRFSWDGEHLRLWVDDRDVSEAIRAEAVGRGASDVAVHPAVRLALLERQRALGRAGGVVMDGRDIGTVVLPDADLKIFLDASPEERAARRFRELGARGVSVDYDQVLADVRARDAQDRGRATAPLRAADDAQVLDSTHHSAAEVADEIVRLACARLDGGTDIS